MDKVIIYTDGGSRGNPGPAAAGFVLSDTAGQQLQANAFTLEKLQITLPNIQELLRHFRRLAIFKQKK